MRLRTRIRYLGDNVGCRRCLSNRIHAKNPKLVRGGVVPEDDSAQKSAYADIEGVCSCCGKV